MMVIPKKYRAKPPLGLRLFCLLGGLFLVWMVFVILFVTPALATVPVKDRCADTDVLKSVLELMDDFYPSKFSDKAAFIFDPDKILTAAYDANLDKVTCTSEFVLLVDYVDPNKKSWALAAHKLGFTRARKALIYEMQYVSGSTDRFNVVLRKTYDLEKVK